MALDLQGEKTCRQKKANKAVETWGTKFYYECDIRRSIRAAGLIASDLQTGLPGSGARNGTPLDEFCDAVFLSVSVRTRDDWVRSDRYARVRQLVEVAEPVFKQRSANFSVATYASATQSFPEPET